MHYLAIQGGSRNTSSRFILHKVELSIRASDSLGLQDFTFTVCLGFPCLSQHPSFFTCSIIFSAGEVSEIETEKFITVDVTLQSRIFCGTREKFKKKKKKKKKKRATSNIR